MIDIKLIEQISELKPLLEVNSKLTQDQEPIIHVYVIYGNNSGLNYDRDGSMKNTSVVIKYHGFVNFLQRATQLPLIGAISAFVYEVTDPVSGKSIASKDLMMSLNEKLFASITDAEVHKTTRELAIEAIQKVVPKKKSPKPKTNGNAKEQSNTDIAEANDVNQGDNPELELSESASSDPEEKQESAEKNSSKAKSKQQN